LAILDQWRGSSLPRLGW